MALMHIQTSTAFDRPADAAVCSGIERTNLVTIRILVSH